MHMPAVMWDGCGMGARVRPHVPETYADDAMPSVAATAVPGVMFSAMLVYRFGRVVVR